MNLIYLEIKIATQMRIDSKNWTILQDTFPLTNRVNWVYLFSAFREIK